MEYADKIRESDIMNLQIHKDMFYLNVVWVKEALCKQTSGAR